MKNLMLKKTIAYLFIAGTFCPALLSAVEIQRLGNNQITYEEVGNDLINSYGIVETIKPAQDVSAKNSKKKLDLSAPTFSPQEKRCMLFELFARNEAITGTTPELINTALRVTLKDLDVYYGTGEDTGQTLVSKIDNTQTVFGEVGLARAISAPSADASLLKLRQDFIKELVENEALFNELAALFARVRNAESGFFSYLRKNDPVSEQLFKDLYFTRAGFAQLNDSSLALEGLTRLGNLGTAWKIGGDLAIWVGLTYLMAKGAAAAARNMDMKDSMGNPLVVPDATLAGAFKSTYNSIKSLFDPREYIKEYQSLDTEIAKAIAGGAMPADRASLAKKIGTGVLYGKAVAAAAIIGYKSYVIKGAVNQAQQTKDAINYLHTRLIDVATIIDACRQLNELAKENPAMASGVFSIADLQSLFNNEQTGSFGQLIQLLQTNTFKGKASFFSLSGRVLAANKLMTTEIEKFCPCLASLGEIEACLSMAQLYKTMQNERVSYSFVDFVQTDKPYINLVDFWNPFVDANIVVTNSLELGQGAAASKIILTGSNTGGKSTILKGIMINLLLAHTFGMGPAKIIIISPFDFMGSYLRVNDDTAAGDSKFKKEVLRAKMLCQTMDSLEEDEFGFVVIDELFTGTGSEKAAAAANKVAQKLTDLDNNLYILATHFPLLTELEQVNPGVVKNYKIDVLKDEQGNLIRTFKLEEGVSCSNVANEILQEQIQDIDFAL